jgi:hypothetical protein
MKMEYSLGIMHTNGTFELRYGTPRVAKDTVIERIKDTK